jgi:hypothetical protein
MAALTGKDAADGILHNDAEGRVDDLKRCCGYHLLVNFGCVGDSETALQHVKPATERSANAETPATVNYNWPSQKRRRPMSNAGVAIGQCNLACS